MAGRNELDLDAIREYQRQFVSDRDWEKFHSPKNLTMALAGETGELCEIFQWMSDEESRRLRQDHSKYEDVCDELADVLYYLIRISDLLEIPLSKALWDKMKKNEAKYPVEKAKGNARKYTEFGVD